MTLLMLVGAMAGVPIVIGIIQGIDNVAAYQPRYMMPLWVVLIFFMLTMERREDSVTRSQLVTIGIFASVAAFWAHFLLLLRYTHGSANMVFNLSASASWWWKGAPVGANMVWFIGTVCFVSATVLALVLTRDGVGNKLAVAQADD